MDRFQAFGHPFCMGILTQGGGGSGRIPGNMEGHQIYSPAGEHDMRTVGPLIVDLVSQDFRVHFLSLPGLIVFANLSEL